MATRRKRCRVCSALAGMTREICDGCRMAEVRKHIKHRGRTGKPTAEQLHDAHGKSLQTLPPVALPQATYASSAIFSAVATGLDVKTTGPHNFRSETLANAQRFSATLGGVPQNASAAQMFFSYSQKSFYRHMRAMLTALDPSKKAPGRKRTTPSKAKTPNPGALSATNKDMAKALRFIRIYMHVEILPLALKMDCSHTLIWHIEILSNRVQPKWVEAYAKVFEIDEQNIYAFACRLAHYPEGQTDYRALVTDFVDICLRGKAVPGVDEFRNAVFAAVAKPIGLKITVDKAQQIKAAIARGERATAIADRYDISRSAVQDIKKGRTWAHV